MGVVNTGLLTAGLRSDFFNRYNSLPSMSDRLATRVASGLATEQYRWLGMVPQMREWVAGRQLKGLRSESYDVDNLRYEASIAVDQVELDRDQTGQIRMRINEMADRAASHKDFLISALLHNGGTAGYVSYDGLTYFNDAHVSGASGNQDNNRTSAAATGTQPTVAEFQAAMEEGWAAMRSFKDDQGEPLNIRFDGVVVIVPPCYEWVARQALNATIIAATDNVMRGAADVMVDLFSPDVDRFYLALTGANLRPFIFQDEKPITFEAVAENDAEARFFQEHKYGVDARYAIAYAAWYTIVRHIFT
ncbi:MAG TPA: Mu-like prophage major head subunit gpT family protein [Phycisphaerae bacterium]|nr:Mu-like prophage major head subunit gpT family protein [Phycisphaerae bacterium]